MPQGAPAAPEKGNQFAGALSHVYASCEYSACAVRPRGKRFKRLDRVAHERSDRLRGMTLPARAPAKGPLEDKHATHRSRSCAKSWSKRSRPMVETLATQDGAKVCAAETGGKVAKNRPRLKPCPDKLPQPTRFAAGRA